MPVLNLVGKTSKQPQRLKTDNELELERRASVAVTGPHDKQWESFGVEKVDDKEQIIDTNKQISKK